MALMFITIWIREETEHDSPERAFWTDTHTSLGISRVHRDYRPHCRTCPLAATARLGNCAQGGGSNA